MTKKVLFCLTGLTPQVVTETLYALAHRKPAWFPDEIHLLTTVQGAEHARLTLFVEEGGWFHRLIREYSLPPVDFSEEHIHVIKDEAGVPLEDIRTEADNRRLADAITVYVRRWCMDPEVELHVSLAGGRKTMSFFAGYILSLFGRQQDRLSHVLVEPAPFERHPQFFYPTRNSSSIRDHSGQIMDRAQARVELVEVPFLRLQPALDRQILEGMDSFDALIERLQADIGPQLVRFDMPALKLFIGKQPVETVRGINFLFYSWLAWRYLQGLSPIDIPPNEDVPGDKKAAESLIDWIEQYGMKHRDFERTVEALKRDGLSHTFIRDRKNRINRSLKQALGLSAQHYQLHIPRGTHRVMLSLSPHQIVFES